MMQPKLSGESQEFGRPGEKGDNIDICQQDSDVNSFSFARGACFVLPT
jgi:hypothetical protein